MKKLLIMFVFFASLLVIGWRNYQIVLGESSDLGRRPGAARLTGYSLVRPNDAQALLIQGLKVSPLGDRIDLAFDLVSQYGLNEFPAFRVIVTTTTGVRTFDVPSRSYNHPEGQLSIAPISFSIPRTGSETNVAVKAVYP